MQLSVSGKHLDIGDSLRGHVTSAISASAGRYFGRAIEGKVVFQRARRAYRADITLHVARGLLVQSHGEAADPYLAFDAAAERLDKQLRRTKRRLVSRRRDSDEGEAAAPESAVAQDQDGGEDRDHGGPAVVAEVSVKIETLTVGEATERLGDADAQVLMFRNRTHGGYNVLYRRADGTIGWIDPPHAAAGRSAKSAKSR
jgi:ribosomal subunit interface protein